MFWISSTNLFTSVRCEGPFSRPGPFFLKPLRNGVCQPGPPMLTYPSSEIRPYHGLITHWFPLDKTLLNPRKLIMEPEKPPGNWKKTIIFFTQNNLRDFGLQNVWKSQGCTSSRVFDFSWSAFNHQVPPSLANSIPAKDPNRSSHSFWAMHGLPVTSVFDHSLLPTRVPSDAYSLSRPGPWDLSLSGLFFLLIKHVIPESLVSLASWCWNSMTDPEIWRDPETIGVVHVHVFYRGFWSGIGMAKIRNLTYNCWSLWSFC